MRLEQGPHRTGVAGRECAAQPGLGRHRRPGASRSIASSQLYLRQAGATAREMLIAAAAARWHVPAAECSARNSIITHNPSGRTVSFGAVAARRGQDRAAGGRRPEAAGRLEARRQPAQAARCSRQDHGAAGLRHRRPPAGHAVCRDRAVSGVRRRAEGSRRKLDRWHEGRARRGAHAGCGCRGGRIRGGGRSAPPTPSK